MLVKIGYLQFFLLEFLIEKHESSMNNGAFERLVAGLVKNHVCFLVLIGYHLVRWDHLFFHTSTFLLFQSMVCLLFPWGISITIGRSFLVYIQVV